MKKILGIASMFVMIIGSSLTGCDKEQLAQDGTIKYGTSFGMCAGFCRNEITISQNKLVLLRRKNSSDESKICTKDFDAEQQQQLINKIDLPRFFILDERYGCPDCADGGAEWIEIEQDGKKHRVTFEYQREPDAVKAYIKDLRQQMASFTNCK
ncbi:hypothetical protein [Mucilaginibacter sp. CSA2-8R]|uniref:hypothetical protein n=1 Tax=Mucilaginibacter sp. CSA2-8R TaxID=3141542 RepID=UPI00315DF97B